jgi:hypothetical protein
MDIFRDIDTTVYKAFNIGIKPKYLYLGKCERKDLRLALADVVTVSDDSYRGLEIVPVERLNWLTVGF